MIRFIIIDFNSSKMYNIHKYNSYCGESIMAEKNEKQYVSDNAQLMAE